MNLAPKAKQAQLAILPIADSLCDFEKAKARLYSAGLFALTLLCQHVSNPVDEK